MRRLSAEEVRARKTGELGLDPRVFDLTAPESLAAALRRAASYVCPCSAETLVRAVVQPLRELVRDLRETRRLVKETLEAMISHGDILEQPELEDGTPNTRMLLYAAPPSFVARQSGLVVLLGVAADRPSLVPSGLDRQIHYRGHVRRLIPSSPAEDLRSELRQLGLLDLPADLWLKAPKRCTPSQAVAASHRALDSVPPSRDIPGLLILDPAEPVLYYRGRWAAPRAQTGCFVGRRQQAYGADLWCYVRLENGQPERVIDLPQRGNRWRGCDEAWHLQMAIDAHRGAPQRYRVTPSGDTVVLDFFSPIPSWARRRWDAMGEPVTSTGSLFAYRIPTAELEEERRFMREALWLEETTQGSR